MKNGEVASKRAKWLTILLIASIVFNVFFILIAIIGCSTKPQVSAANENIYNKQERLNLSSYDLNINSKAYDLRVNSIIKPNEITESYYNDYYVSLGGENGVVVRNNQTDTMVALNSEIHVQFRINANNINNSLIWINWGDGTLNSYVADSNTNSWVAWHIDLDEPLPLLNNEIYLPNSLGYDAENYSLFKSDLNNWFTEINYYDVDLAHWSPYAFVSNSFLISGQTQGVKYCIKNCLFSINGNIYDTIYYFLSVGDGFVYDNGQSFPLEAGQGYISFVVARNSLNNREMPLMECETRPVTNNGGTTLAVVKDSLRFINNANSKVRLWSTYSEDTSVYSDAYTNYAIFTATFDGFSSNVGGGTGSFGDVFGLFTNAMTGVFDMLQINILPGVSLAMFVMLPLVGMIIFAIIKIIKK